MDKQKRKEGGRRGRLGGTEGGREGWTILLLATTARLNVPLTEMGTKHEKNL